MLDVSPATNGGAKRKRHTATWKTHERECAKRLGGKRVGPSGTSTADVVNEYLSVECKMRTSLPAWLKAAMQQSVDASATSQLPIVILHELGQRHDGDLVMLRLKDFEDHMGSVWKRENA
jgi:hypothetical protein